LDWIQSLLLGERERGVHEAHHVPHGLRGQAASKHRGGKSLDVLRADVVDAAVPERRRDVDAMHRFAVRDVGRSSALDVDSFAQLGHDVVDRSRPFLHRGWPPKALRLDHAAQRTLGLSARQSVGAAAFADLAQLAVQVAPVGRPPAPVVGAGLRVETASAVGACHARRRADERELDPVVQQLHPNRTPDPTD
jgi:hypothetical protein